MWDTLFILLTLTCFGIAVFYVPACVRLKKGQNNG